MSDWPPPCRGNTLQCGDALGFSLEALRSIKQFSIDEGAHRICTKRAMLGKCPEGWQPGGVAKCIAPLSYGGWRWYGAHSVCSWVRCCFAGPCPSSAKIEFHNDATKQQFAAKCGVAWVCICFACLCRAWLLWWLLCATSLASTARVIIARPVQQAGWVWAEVFVPHRWSASFSLCWEVLRMLVWLRAGV